MSKKIPLIGEQFLIAANPRMEKAAIQRAHMLGGYQLILANILYHMPDHPNLLQAFLWQTYDLKPQYPELRKFLNFWENNLDGKLHSVEVAGKQLIGPSEIRYALADFSIN